MSTFIDQQMLRLSDASQLAALVDPPGDVLDAKVTVEMGDGATADTFCVTLFDLPASSISQLRSGYSSGGLKVTIRLGYFDDLSTRFGSRPVMTGRVTKVATEIGDGGVTETTIEGHDETGYVLRNKQARLDRSAASPRLKLVRDLLPAGVSLGPGSTITESTKKPAPVPVDPELNLVSRVDAQTEASESAAAPPSSEAGAATKTAVRTGLEVIILGHPELRAGQDVTVKGLDDVPANPLRISRVTHTYGTTSGYTCALTVTAIAPAKRARVTGGVQGVVDRGQDVIERNRSDHPAIDVGQVTAYKPGKDGKHLTDLNYGQQPKPNVVAPSVASPVDQDVKQHDKPIAAPFAFHKAGLVTPVYPGMRAVLVHHRSLVRVLVIDDIRLYRDCLVALLRQQPGITAAAGVGGGDEALLKLGNGGFEAVLLSLTTAGSIQICRELAASIPVVVLAVSEDDDEVVACAQAGVVGYVMRDDSEDALVTVIAGAARGETSCPRQVAAALMRRMGPRGSRPPAPAGAARLTAREREILGLIDDGMSNKEIARKLSIEVRTVKNHVHNLLEKLSVHRRGEAAALLRAHRDPYRA